MGTDTLITDQTSEEVSEKETLGAGTSSQGEEKPNGQTDVEKKIQELSEKAEHDINALKSTFQQRETDLQKKIDQQKADYEAHLRELKLSSMDAEQRKAFEAQELLEKNQSFEARARQAEQLLEETKQKNQYRDFFLSVGLPMDKLDMDKDLATFVNEGYALWKLKTKNLEEQVAKLSKKVKGEDEEVEAPDVDTTTHKPGKGTNWRDLIKKYGSAENVYRLIENGSLPPSILPPVE